MSHTRRPEMFEGDQSRGRQSSYLMVDLGLPLTSSISASISSEASSVDFTPSDDHHTGHRFYQTTDLPTPNDASHVRLVESPPVATTPGHSQDNVPSANNQQEARISAREHHEMDPYVQWQIPPKPSSRWSPEKLFDLILDILMVPFPSLFIGIVLAIATRTLDQESTGSDFGLMMERVSKLGPTLFPIIFAAITGRALKALARERLERGERLGILELLMSSRTVFGTIESQFVLGRVSIVGLVLVLLWALSPLGGQASLRMLHRDIRTADSSTQFLYMPTGILDNNLTYARLARGTDGFGSANLPVITAIFSASLLAPVQAQALPQDAWGNVRLPRLLAPGANARAADLDGWYAVPQQMRPEDYTSLVGIPVSRPTAPDGTTSSFTLEYSYTGLICTEKTSLRLSSDEALISQNLTLAYSMVGRPWNASSFSSMFGSNIARKDNSTFSISFHDPVNPAVWTTSSDGVLSLRNDSFTKPRTLTWLSKEVTVDNNSPGPPSFVKDNMIVRNCSLRQEYAQAKIECEKDSCQARAIRPATRFSGVNRNVSWFDRDLNSSDTSLNAGIAHNFPYAAGSSLLMSPIEAYIRGSPSTFFADNSAPSALHLDDSLFAARLGLLLNTWLLLYDTPFVTGTYPPPDADVWKDPLFKMTALEGYGPTPVFLPLTTQAQIQTIKEIYRCDPVWYTIMLLASLVLVVLSFVSIFYKFVIRGPDVLGYVSSMLYDNRYISMPPGGSTLDGMEKSARLWDLKVRLGDVCSEDKIGHIGLGAGKERIESMMHITRWKLYQ
ncbi:Hypothetical protein D9617_1g083500 [Elsinoe fawcettii]|nr:Hypothetical protein D9617_1g083500 [Elsinoe fawcettii]